MAWPPDDERQGKEGEENAQAVKAAKARPKYYSDGDTRPVYRGAAYAAVRQTGIAWAALAAYGAFALWSFSVGAAAVDSPL